MLANKPDGADPVRGMRMVLLLTQVLALISTGLYAGIIFGDRLGATYARAALSAASFIQFQQIQHVHFKPVLLPVTLIAVVTSIAWVVMSLAGWQTAGFWLAAVAAGAMTCAFLVTRIVNFPINDALMSWNPAAPPPDVRALWAPWERAHSLRAILSVGAFVLQAIALASRHH